MLLYIYTRNYDEIISTQLSQGSVIASTDDTLARTFNYERIIDHVLLYSITDKYNVADLKALAGESFHHSVQGRWPLPHFPAIFRNVFSSTPPNDKELRDTTAKICAQHIEELLNEKEDSAPDTLHGTGESSDDDRRITLKQILARDADLAIIVLEKVVQEQAEFRLEYAGMKRKHDQSEHRIRSVRREWEDRALGAEQQLKDYKAMMLNATRVPRCCSNAGFLVHTPRRSTYGSSRLRLRCTACRKLY